MIDTLRTERLILRPPVVADCDAFCAFHTSDRAIYTGGQLTYGKAWRGFAGFLGHWTIRGYGMFVITLDGEPIGSAGAWHPGDWPEREIGWTIWSPEYEGKGIAYEAAVAARHHVFATLGWNTAVSYIAPGNARSIALAERLGARRDDKAKRPEVAECVVYRHDKVAA